MEHADAVIRLAAFRFLEEQLRLAPEDGALSREVLTRGFIYEGQRVPLMGPQGIFKPRLLRQIPLSITTVAIVEGETRPYDDVFGPDGLLRYRYRGTNPAHHENVGLRLAMQHQVPLPGAAWHSYHRYVHVASLSTVTANPASALDCNFAGADQAAA